MYKKSKHTKVRYDKVGEPRDNKRVKAHVGDVIEFTNLNGDSVWRGRVIRITHSKKTRTNLYGLICGEYSDWFYKIRFENGFENWLQPTTYWRVIKDANKDRE